LCVRLSSPKGCVFLADEGLTTFGYKKYVKAAMIATFQEIVRMFNQPVALEEEYLIPALSAARLDEDEEEEDDIEDDEDDVEDEEDDEDEYEDDEEEENEGDEEDDDEYEDDDEEEDAEDDDDVEDDEDDYEDDEDE